jgi:signal transduction histidine kinase
MTSAAAPGRERARPSRAIGAPRAGDAALAGAAFAATLALLATGVSANAGEAHPLDALGVVLAGVSSLPLLAWRRAPVATFVVTALASAALNALGYDGGPPVGPTLALYGLVLRREEAGRSTRVTLAVVVAMFAVHLAGAGIGNDGLPTTELLFGVVVWGAAWTAADRTRLRRQRVTELEERAARAERDAERERRLAAAEERTRIARDLHDSAGHAINVILVQAGAARLLHDRDPAGSRAAIETIEAVARDTIAEIDQLVRALRDDGEGAEVEPPPGLSALERLAERHRASGLAVAVRYEGRPRALAPAVDQAAYRILQESLTNAARHGAGSATVDVTYADAALELAVANPVEGEVSAAGGGHGLDGMRERAALLGGRLEAGARAGEWRVWARLPAGDPRAT